MNEFLWVEKYRPETVDECILPEITKEMFKGFLEQGEIPNLLLAGPAGIGKTTIAKALCKELDADYYVINGSDEGRFLDTVRNQAKSFASTVSLASTAKHKVIIIDEADNTTPDVQMLLRANIEEFQNVCRFIFTCNYKNRIIEPIHSRCSVVDFHVKGREKQQLATTFFKRVHKILATEGIDFEMKVVAEVVQKPGGQLERADVQLKVPPVPAQQREGVRHFASMVAAGVQFWVMGFVRPFTCA